MRYDVHQVMLFMGSAVLAAVPVAVAATVSVFAWLRRPRLAAAPRLPAVSGGGDAEAFPVPAAGRQPGLLGRLRRRGRHAGGEDEDDYGTVVLARRDDDADEFVEFIRGAKAAVADTLPPLPALDDPDWLAKHQARIEARINRMRAGA
jgi:hypothetical protein